MAATNFSATLQCPGNLMGATLQIDGATMVAVTGINPDGEKYTQDLYAVTSQKAMRQLIAQGWKLVSITPASGGGNQGW